jgi:hypothetical protein
MTYDKVNEEWTHRLTPGTGVDSNGVIKTPKKVETWHVTDLTNEIDIKQNPTTAAEKTAATAAFENIIINRMRPSTENMSQRGVPILVISDIGKSWSDYEGNLMSRERFFRLCEVLDSPDESYAIAVDDFGGTDPYHSDLGIPNSAKSGKTEIYSGRHYLDKCAAWDISGVGNGSGTAKDDDFAYSGIEYNVNAGIYEAGKYQRGENKFEKFNNPVQHLFNGSYTTLDDPRTGAGCVGYLATSKQTGTLDDATGAVLFSVKFAGSNFKKMWGPGFAQNHWGIELNDEGLERSMFSAAGSSESDFAANFGINNAYLEYRKYREDLFQGITYGQLGVGNFVPDVSNQIVHPSRFVFQPIPVHAAVSGVNAGSDIGVATSDVDLRWAWAGGDPTEDANDIIAGNPPPIPSTNIRYIQYQQKHHGYAAKDATGTLVGRPDKGSQTGVNSLAGVIMDISGALRKDTDENKRYFLNDASHDYDDVYGVSEFSIGDGFVDNSRYRWAGSTYGNGGTYAERLDGVNSVKFNSEELTGSTYKTPSLLNNVVVKAVKFKLDTQQPTVLTERYSSTLHRLPTKSWMDAQNQGRYWDHLYFFMTRSWAGNSLLQKEESMEAKSERSRFHNLGANKPKDLN